MRRLKTSMVSFAIDHCKSTIFLAIIVTVIAASFFPQVQIDTDPEHMLPENEPSRIFHNHAKKVFDLSEIVVLGVVNEKDPDGVFNPGTLSRVNTLAKFARTLRWKDENDPSKTAGVISVDMIAPSMVEDITQVAPGTISFDWLMPEPPATREQALEIRERIMANPMLADRLASMDGKAMILYLPLTDKQMSYRVYSALNEKIAELGGDDEYHITGLPVAQDAIGVEMFTELMLASPLTMATIFLLLFYFFRRVSLTILPMLIATFSVVITMGAMIALDFKVHIMSSMIPTFLMSIAVVDSIHILSEFFDSYTVKKGRKRTIRDVLQTLFMPMLYTSLTSAAGFISLALTPIPPVQVFGVFVGVGIMVAWVLTIMFVPAYILILPRKSFSNFGLSTLQERKPTALTRLLAATGTGAARRAKPLATGLMVLIVLSAWGISKIQINDNPVKWFAKSHPIRKADMALRTHFSGTYPAYLILEGDTDARLTQPQQQAMSKRFIDYAEGRGTGNEARDKARLQLKRTVSSIAANPKESFLETAMDVADLGASNAASDEEYFLWDDFRNFFSMEREKLRTFKNPEVLRYVAQLQRRLQQNGLVRKSVSPADVVSKINQELTDGDIANYRVPDKEATVGECYMQFQQSHRPHDLWHFVTPDFAQACAVMQLPSGDNKVMEEVETFVDDYFANQPPPRNISHKWAGLTYINVAWQNQMVEGMLRSFLGSFVTVLIMTMLLFRSVKWGVLCMIPLTVTIAIIYGFIGLIGKDYDMPVAVLGVLTLGMSVDFAIHFVERCRKLHGETGSWSETLPLMFGAPARAISRNVTVIAFGFLPLLVSSLVPYKTTSLLLSSIMLLSGMLTLVAMPAIITLAHGWFFRDELQ